MDDFMISPTTSLEFNLPIPLHGYHESPKSTSRELTIATYNIYDHFKHRDRRTDALAELFTTLEADVICLQEVTHNVLSDLSNRESIQKNWVSSGERARKTASNSWHDFGLVTFYRRTKFSEAKICIVDLRTAQQRYLQVSKLRLRAEGNAEDLYVFNVHLESMSYGLRKREEQLQEIRAYIEIELSDDLKRDSAHLLLAGDLNLSQEWEVGDEFLAAKGWIDLDLSMRKYNTINCHPLEKSAYPPARFDRILRLRDQASSFVVKGSRQFGMDPIFQEDGEAVYISDHVGVLVTFERPIKIIPEIA